MEYFLAEITTKTKQLARETVDYLKEEIESQWQIVDMPSKSSEEKHQELLHHFQTEKVLQEFISEKFHIPLALNDFGIDLSCLNIRNFQQYKCHALLNHQKLSLSLLLDTFDHSNPELEQKYKEYNFETVGKEDDNFIVMEKDFPRLSLKFTEGEKQEMLKLLHFYCTFYRPRIGYGQGMTDFFSLFYLFFTRNAYEEMKEQWEIKLLSVFDGFLYRKKKELFSLLEMPVSFHLDYLEKSLNLAYNFDPKKNFGLKIRLQLFDFLLKFLDPLFHHYLTRLISSEQSPKSPELNPHMQWFWLFQTFLLLMKRELEENYLNHRQSHDKVAMNIKDLEYESVERILSCWLQISCSQWCFSDLFWVLSFLEIYIRPFLLFTFPMPFTPISNQVHMEVDEPMDELLHEKWIQDEKEKLGSGLAFLIQFKKKILERVCIDTEWLMRGSEMFMKRFEKMIGKNGGKWQTLELPSLSQEELPSAHDLLSNEDCLFLLQLRYH